MQSNSFFLSFLNLGSQNEYSGGNGNTIGKLYQKNTRVWLAPTLVEFHMCIYNGDESGFLRDPDKVQICWTSNMFSMVF